MSAQRGEANAPERGKPLVRKRSRDASGDLDDARRVVQAMETTFITIHDLTRDANILYCSQSVTDVLDWSPEDVTNKPCWDFFHPDEVSFAKNIHGHGVQLDKASVLNYCRIKNKRGEWVGCECVFTIVYNVMIGCTSVYFDGPKAKKRAVEAPVVRQLFSSSPRDPRYHMLSYISDKFRHGPRPRIHEPRAALFLNRFTRTLTINFATDGLADILGIAATELQGQSFYYCIQENCLSEAVRCLESAKANDSIAYLRFWYRDPRSDDIERHQEILGTTHTSDSDGKEDSAAEDEDHEEHDEDEDEDEDEDGGVEITPRIRVDGDSTASAERDVGGKEQTSSDNSSPHGASLTPDGVGEPSRRSSSDPATIPSHLYNSSSHHSSTSHRSSASHRSSTPRTAMSLDSPPFSPSRHTSGETVRPAGLVDGDGTAIPARPGPDSARRRSAVELEAVISCTSDGLVVVLRAARPFVPTSVRLPPQQPITPYDNGLFASPWASDPVLPRADAFPSQFVATHQVQISPYSSTADGPYTARSTQSVRSFVTSSDLQDFQEPNVAHRGPAMTDVMQSIRDVAVFAWALTGINGSLISYGRGKPLIGAIPKSGLPVWDPDGRLRREQERDGPPDDMQKPDDQQGDGGHPRLVNGSSDAADGRDDGLSHGDKNLEVREQEITDTTASPAR